MLRLWSVSLIVLTILAFFLVATQQHQNRQNAIDRHNERMKGVQAGLTEPERTPPPGHEADVAVKVKVGAYLDRIPFLSIVASEWKADFYIWFEWDDAPDLNPGESFKIVGGELLSRALLHKVDNGSHHYALYRAVADITKTFDVARFPCDEHLLTIQVEDQALQSYELTYVTDPAASGISSRVAVPGYEPAKIETNVVPHSYKTSLGDPRLPSTYKATYSQFILGIPLMRPSWGLFFKMFIGLYVSITIAIGGMFLRVYNDRLALGGTALFAAVANGMAITPLVPAVGVMTLADVVNDIGYVSIGAVILQTLLYHNRFPVPDQHEAAIEAFDWVSIALIGIGFVALNLAATMF